MVATGCTSGNPVRPVGAVRMWVGVPRVALVPRSTLGCHRPPRCGGKMRIYSHPNLFSKAPEMNVNVSILSDPTLVKGLISWAFLRLASGVFPSVFSIPGKSALMVLN
jgi:hypothetical protein